MLKKSHRVFGLSLLPAAVMSVLLFAEGSDLVQGLQESPEIGILTFLLSIPLYYIGTTFPDIDMKLKAFFKYRYEYHRQFTHSILLYVGVIYYLLFQSDSLDIYAVIPLMFLFGVLTHIIGDMLTGSVPWFLYGHYGIPWQRIGITTFLPKIIHPLFTEKLPKFLNKHIYINVLLGFIPFSILTVYAIYNGLL